MSFRELYEDEINGFWERLGRLAVRYPRLERLYARDADSRVARLVQSAGFAFASTRERLEDDGQSLLRPVVGRALPECLRPRPASTILELSHQRGFAGDVLGTTFEASVDGIEAPFEVVWSAVPGPFELEDVRIDRLHARLQVLRFVLVARDGASLGNVLPEWTRFFVHVDQRKVALDVLHSLRAAKEEGRVVAFDGEGRRVSDIALSRDAFRWSRIDTDEPPLVSARQDRFVSSTLLRDLAAFPESFCFFSLQLGARSERVARVEVTLPLGRVVEEVSAFGLDNLRLFCVPATNQFVAPIETLRAKAGPEWSLAVAERPHAEILEIRSLYAELLPTARGRLDIDSWEAPRKPHRFDSDALYYLVEQDIVRTEARTRMRLSLGTVEGFFAPAPSDLGGDVLASDGTIVATLGLGDVAGHNITRISRSERALLGQDYGWRMNAYARMPPVRLAESLDEFVALHRAHEPHENDAEIHVPRFVDPVHQREHRLAADGFLQWGDVWTVGIGTDASECSDGEAWVTGALVARALAERNEHLRFSRLVLQRGRHVFAEYDAPEGKRLPFPLG